MNSTLSFNGLATAAESIGERLREAGQTLAVAESSTGGLMSAALLSVAGASAYFRGGSVVYTLEARRELLGLRGSDVRGLEPLSEPIVQVFAEVAGAQLKSTWDMAELGAAGPTGARYGHPAGTCVLAVVGPVTLTTTLSTNSSDRLANMLAFSHRGLELLESALGRAGTA